MNKNLSLFLIGIIISISSFAQKPKKIFSFLEEGKLQEAMEEYNLISSEKKYDNEDKILFEISNCLLMIAPNSSKYNPIQSIKNFNNLVIIDKEKEGVITFLKKYELDSLKISERIHSEIVIQAKKINSIESYSNALIFCSISSKDELQKLLERQILDKAKFNNSISELNNYIQSYSNYKIEATNYRDSIVLSIVPKEYNALLKFTKEFPTSKFNTEIKLKLPDLLLKESLEINTLESLKKFITEFPNDSRINIVNHYCPIKIEINRFTS